LSAVGRLQGHAISHAQEQPVRVLVVDDDPGFRTLLRVLVDADPVLILVGEAEDGAEAIELARLHSPDVIVMDLNMPVLDGVAATRRLVAEQPGTQIVICSSSEELVDITTALAAGAAGFVSKGDATTALLPLLVELAEAAYAPDGSRVDR
jgi:DNA-binding NarL/FixJ family response regulator